MMNRLLRLLCILVVIPGANMLAVTTAQAVSELKNASNQPSIAIDGLELDVFYGKQSTVNAYVFSDGQSSILLDALDSHLDASELISLIESKKQPLTTIFISHGHPDHFSGLAALHEAFPKAKILLPSQGAKEEMMEWVDWLAKRFWLHDSMQPKSEQYPDGFDYENLVQITDQPYLSLASGKQLVIERDYQPSESRHMATLYSKDLNAFFSGDLVSNQVHLWFDNGADAERMTNWKGSLSTIIEKYHGTDVTIYPGHGKPGKLSLLEDMIEYMDIFAFVIKTSKNDVVAVKKMKMLFPSYAEQGLLTFSVEQHYYR